MYTIALKMLMGDRAKYIMLISALTFSALLITQQTSVFFGLMHWTTATLRNTQVPVWVMDPHVEQVNEAKPMRSIDLSRVRSVKGVAWAVPFYSSLQQARLIDGNFKSVQLLGLDSATLIGAPPVMLKGRLEDLRQAHAVIIDQVGIEKLSEGRVRPLKVGDIFEINDHEVRIVGICEAARSFFGYPFIYTTFDQALAIVPKTRKNVAFILVQPLLHVTPEEVALQIQQDTGLKALTDKDFFWSTIRWFIKNTGIPISFGTTIILGLIVGIAVSGQTFYSFILENLSNLGALKAMGASNGLLYRLLLLQAFTVGFIGYGLGIGLASAFGLSALKNGLPPFYMPPLIPLATLGMILLICSVAALISIRRLSQLETAEVFRG
jgi:putative ABC transport system permease protein